MSKKRNLFACLICLLFTFVCLVSCTAVTLSPKAAAQKQAESDAQEVLGKLVWDEEDRTAVVSSLSFATQNKNYPGVTISWSSSEEDIISNTGKVVRPSSDDPRNVLVGEDLLSTVVITATVVAEYSWVDNGTFTETTEPISKQFTFTVLAKPEGTDMGDIKDVKLRAWDYIYVQQGVDKALVSNSSVTYNVMLSGVVTAKLNADGATKGFMLHDGTDGIYVYGDNTNVKIGDYVEVIGGIYSYYGSLQVGSNVSVAKSNGQVKLPAYTEVKVQQWENQNAGLGDEVIGHLGGDLYKVEGYLTENYNSTTKDEYCLVDAETGEVAWIYYKSYNAEMKEVLAAHVGQYVKVTGAGYDRDSRIVKNHLLWDGGLEVAEAPKVDDETKANVALAQITLNDSYDADFDLNAAGSWKVVSGTGVEISEGVAKVTRGEEDQVVVLEVSVTVGSVTVSKQLTVTIKKVVQQQPTIEYITVEQAIAIGSAQAHNTYTTEKYYIKGTVTGFYNTTYGNFYITDGTNQICVYGLYSADGSTRYDAMEVKPVDGDEVIVYGVLGQYNGNPQFKNAWFMGFVEAEAEGPFKTDYAYKYEVVQGNTGQTLYLTGNYKNTYYGESTTDLAAAADVYVVAVEGGYNLKLVQANGTVLYINVVASGTHRNIKFEAAPSSVWNYNEELQTFTTLVEGTEYYVGTYGTYDTISPSSIDKAATSFVGHLYDANQGQTPEPPVHEHEFVEGKCECGEVDPDYVAPEVPAASNKADLDTMNNGTASSSYSDRTSAAGWVATGAALNAGAANEATNANPVFGFLGDETVRAVTLNGGTDKTLGTLKSPVLSGGLSKLTFNYTNLFTDTKFSVTVYVKNAAGEVLYEEVVAYDNPDKVKYEVRTFTLEAQVEGEFIIEIINNRPNQSTGNKDRATIWNIEWVGYEVEVHEHNFVEGKCECGEEDPNYVPEPTEITIKEAIALEDGAKVIIVATVDAVEAWSEQYGNMSFTMIDKTGSLYVFRSSTKVALGDIVTVEGTMATYYESRQIAQGAVVTIVGHDDSYDVVEEGAVTITFDNKSKRTEFDKSHQIWSENGITVTNNKSASTSDVADYAGPARFYASSQLIIESEQSFTKITFKTNSKNFNSNFTVSGATVTVSGSTCTIVFAEAVNSFEITKLPYQIRVDYITLEK